jgi:hypothetical protein
MSSLARSLVVFASLALAGCPLGFDHAGLRGDALPSEGEGEVVVNDATGAAHADASDAAADTGDGPGATDAFDAGLRATDASDASDAGDGPGATDALDASHSDAALDAGVEVEPDAHGDTGPGDSGPGDNGAGGPGTACNPDAGLLCQPAFICARGHCCNSNCTNDCDTCMSSGICISDTGAPCGAVFDCTNTIYGSIQSANYTNCFAYSGSVRGSCNPNRSCLAAGPQQCISQPAGADIGSCDNACLLSSQPCTQGQPVGTFFFNQFCSINTRTMSCLPDCIDMMGGSETRDRTCNNAGTCVTLSSNSCLAYKCDQMTGTCNTSCSGNSQCYPTFVCDGGSCVSP